jgi:hypothetical protein
LLLFPADVFTDPIHHLQGSTGAQDSGIEDHIALPHQLDVPLPFM